MNRIAAVLVFLLSTCAFGSEVSREAYQAVISEKYPGFVIMRREWFEYPTMVVDGKSGALIVGNFNLDDVPDFAAKLIIPSGDQFPETGNVYLGMLVTCFGKPKGGYDCKNSNYQAHIPHGWVLTLVLKGKHQCLDGNQSDVEWVEVVSEADSIGEYSESGGGFDILQRDGSYISCIDSD